MKNLVLLSLLCFLPFSPSYAQQWRVKAIIQETYQDTGSGNKAYFPVDSSAYTYNPYSNRGSSSWRNDTILYDKWEAFVKDGILSKTYKNVGNHWVRNYYNDDRISSHSTVSTLSVHIVGALDSYYYANGRLSRIRKYSWNVAQQKLLEHTREEYSYNSNGQIELIKNYSINVLTGRVYFERWTHFGYNTNGDLIKDSIADYDHNNATWSSQKDMIYTYKYNSTGDVIEKVCFVKASGQSQYILYRKDYYAYTSTGKPLHDSLEVWYNGKQYSADVHHYSYNGQGLLFTDTFYRYRADTLLYYTVDMYLYTSFGYVSEWYKGSSQVPYFYNRRYRFQYEHYWPLEVPNESQGPPPNTGLSISPVPASDVLNIHWYYADAENVQGHIIDMNGRVWMQWEEKAKLLYGAYRYTKKIATSSLASGNYYLVLRTSEGVYHKQFVVVR